MALELVTLVDSISKLKVDEVRFYDLDTIPASDVRSPFFFPEPLEFISNFVLTRDSFGGGSVALQHAEYDLTFTFCYKPLGTGRAGLADYVGMVTLAAEILDAIIAIDVISGAEDVRPAELREFGQVPDPSGNMYLGCKIVIHVMEFVN